MKRLLVVETVVYQSAEFQRRYDMQKKQKNRPSKAVKHFMNSMNCSQAVLETFASSFGIEVKTARRISAAFAGGMGRGSECGAVTGALMVLGMRYGKTKSKDPKADEKLFAKTAEFIKEFKARHIHVRCSALLGTHMSTPPAWPVEREVRLLCTSRQSDWARNNSLSIEIVQDGNQVYAHTLRIP